MKERSVRIGIKEVNVDPEVRQIHGQYVPNVGAYFSQVERRKSLEFYIDPIHNTTFYLKYLNDVLIPNLQSVLLGRAEVGAGLARIATGTEQLRKEYRE